MFLFVSDHQRSQRLPKTGGIESETISAIVSIVKDRQRSQRFNGNRSTGIATIVKIAAIVRVLRFQRSQRFYGNQSSAIITVVNDHMETEGGLYFWEGVRKIPLRFDIQISELLFRCKCAPRDNFLGRVSREGNIC